MMQNNGVICAEFLCNGWALVTPIMNERLITHVRVVYNLINLLGVCITRMSSQVIVQAVRVLCACMLHHFAALAFWRRCAAEMVVFSTTKSLLKILMSSTQLPLRR